MAKPLDISKQAYTAFTNGNIPALLDLLADDVEWRFLARPEYGTPYGGTFRGKQAVGSFFAKLAEMTQIVEFEPRDFLEGPNHVTTIGRTKGRMLPDGAVHESDWVHVAVVNSAGKIARWIGTEDSAAKLSK